MFKALPYQVTYRSDATLKTTEVHAQPLGFPTHSMRASEHMLDSKATRLLTPVANPLLRKHENITDLRLRRLTQTDD